MGQDWSPSTWQQRRPEQMPAYDDEQALRVALDRLRCLPPLVTSWEVLSLRQQLAEVAHGQRFLLQGGDCSESFADCASDIIACKLKILLQMSLLLIHGSKKRVTRVVRLAGQYAKPRSADLETRDGVALPSYRGDLVNQQEFTATARQADPQRLLTGYSLAALTLNFIRSLADGGFADLHHPEYWDLGFVQHSPQKAEYERLVAAISESIGFLETVTGQKFGDLGRVDFYTSHECLHLFYEQAQTRQVPHRVGWFNLSTHFPWIGHRTRSRDGAHVEYCRGIQNPIGVKAGPGLDPDELLQLIEVLNPDNIAGRLTIIHRFGEQQIARQLPPLIEAVERHRKTVVWCCDPMHGNTDVVGNGYKTRGFEQILSELEQAFEIHRRKGTYLGGVHFELTGENVTECTGGARGLKVDDLGRAYRSQVDPRLNYEQALEMAMLIAQQMRS